MIAGDVEYFKQIELDVLLAMEHFPTKMWKENWRERVFQIRILIPH